MKDTGNTKQLRGKRGFWFAVYNIIVADMSMSLDNVLAIGGIAHGNIVMIAFRLLFNIPVIFFGSQLVAPHVNRAFSRIFPWIIAVIIMLYGVYSLRKNQQKKS